MPSRPMFITQIEEAEWLGLPQVVELLEKWAPGRRDMWWELAEAVQSGAAAVFVGSTRPGKLEALAIISHPAALATDKPQVSHFHSDGGPTLRRLLSEKVVDYLRSMGYSTFVAVNRSEHKDSVWARAFHKGGKYERLGSIVEFQLKEPENERLNSALPVRRKRAKVRAEAGRRNPVRRGKPAARPDRQPSPSAAGVGVPVPRNDGGAAGPSA